MSPCLHMKQGASGIPLILPHIPEGFPLAPDASLLALQIVPQSFHLVADLSAHRPELFLQVFHVQLHGIRSFVFELL